MLMAMRKILGGGVRLAVAATGIALVYYFGLSFSAAVENLPGDRTVRALHGGEDVAPSRLREGLQSRRKGQDWMNDPANALDIGVLSLELARRTASNATAATTHLLAARDAFTETLRGIPLASYAWNGLTVSEAALGHARPRIEHLFQMSILNAPVEERLGASRIAFGLQNEAWLSDETQSLIRRQMRLVASMKPDLLSEIAISLGRQAAVADYLESIGGFSDLVRDLRLPR